jgi:hypothetical protein
MVLDSLSTFVKNLFLFFSFIFFNGFFFFREALNYLLKNIIINYQIVRNVLHRLSTVSLSPLDFRPMKNTWPLVNWRLLFIQFPHPHYRWKTWCLSRSWFYIQR